MVSRGLVARKDLFPNQRTGNVRGKGSERMCWELFKKEYYF